MQYLLSLLLSLFSTQIELPAGFSRSVQLSGLTAYNGRLYAPAERCKKIFAIHIDNPQQVDTIDINIDILRNRETELEAITVYNNLLLMTDEKNTCVYAYSLSTKHIDTVSLHGYDLTEDTGDFGIEGIAVDPHKKLCYILKEKDGHNHSILHVFRIEETSGRIALSFVKDLVLPQESNSWRYSDICYDEDSKTLIGLRTFWENRVGKYLVDRIDPGQQVLKDVAKEVNDHVAAYNTNMEGIAIHQHNIYIISDNHMKKVDDCNAPGDKKTLLLKLAL